MSLIDAAITYKRTVISTFVLLLISGIYAYVTIPKESSPDIDIPNIYISMALEGISPGDAERLLLRPMEQELRTIEGIEEMKSSAYQGGGFVLLEFQAGFDKDEAMDDAQKAVDQVRPDLPDDVEEPTVNEVNFSLFPVLIVTLSGDVPERTLVSIAKDLQDDIESIPSVLEAGIAGDREELVEVVLNPVLVESYGLDGEQLISFFQRSNRLVAAGNLDTGAGRFAIEVPGLFENLDDIVDMPIKVSGDSAITVRDIADIRRTFKDPENFARLNGEKAVALEIVKRTGENVIDTIDRVKEVVAEAQKRWPDSISVSYSQDQSERIETRLSDLQNNVISAILLVMIVVVAALGVRSALLVGIAIPGAFLSGILILYIMGLTVNIVVLFALILAVGMLVDGAIVVTELADRKMSEGLPKEEAYAIAAKRMALPIIASTATTLAAFAPLLFWPDIVGEFMKYMPITLIAVLSSSLVVALIFVPTLGALFGKASHDDDPTAKAIAGEHADFSQLTGYTKFYYNILRRALRRPFMILGAALLLLVSVQVTYGFLGKGVEFFPDVEPEVASVLIHARGNLSIYEKDALVREVESRILDVKGVEAFYARAGKATGQGSDLAEDVIGQVQLEFDDWDTRRHADEILQEIRDRTDDLAGIHVETQEDEAGPPTGKDVQIELSSIYPDRLEPMVKLSLQALNEVGGFKDIQDSRPIPGIDWEMQVDRAQAAKFNLDVSTVGQYIRMVTNGLEVGEYRPDDSDDEIDIVLRHPVEDRTIDQLDRVRVFTPEGYVPIANFTERKAKPKVGTIDRVDQKRVITVEADVLEGENVTAKIDEIKAWFEAHEGGLDKAVEMRFRGQNEDQDEAGSFLMKAFGIALFVMAVILVTQFNSFYSAFLILSAVIMSTIGVMIGLMVTGQAFGIVMTGIGIIALAGIIVNNNIVLIDTYDDLRRRLPDLSAHDVILRTGVQRLRPVLLTTITTVLGLIPMTLMMNIDFIARDISIGAPSTQWWVQLSTAVVSGLIFSSVLTLVVTPCALMAKAKFARKPAADIQA